MRYFKRKFHTAATTVILALGLTGVLPAGNAPTAEAAPQGCSNGTHGLFQGTPAGGSSYQFSALQFLNSTTGRAAGNGFVIGTSDAGCNWQSIYQGAWQFSQLDFISNTTGWALAHASASGANALLRTTDGGTHFEKLSGGSSLSLERIHFTDTLHGFGYSRVYTYETADGGRTWTRIPTPANTRGAEFVSSSTGWAVVVIPGKGYEVQQTTDSGKHWKTKLNVSSQEVPGGSIYVSGSRIWVLLNGGAGMSQQSYSLYASTDNGKTWIKTIGQSTAGGGPAPGGTTAITGTGPAAPGGHPGMLQLADGTAILSGYSPAGGKVGVGRSQDGGKTWSNLGTVPGFSGGEISYISPMNGWLAVGGPDEAAVYSTQDGGATWTKTIAVSANQH